MDGGREGVYALEIQQQRGDAQWAEGGRSQAAQTHFPFPPLPPFSTRLLSCAYWLDADPLPPPSALLLCTLSIAELRVYVHLSLLDAA